MSYSTQADLANDGDLRRRVTACAATEHIESPEMFAYDNRWELSTQPGWDAAYARAIADGDTKPGANEGVITDGMILAAVKALSLPDPDPAE